MLARKTAAQGGRRVQRWLSAPLALAATLALTAPAAADELLVGREHAVADGSASTPFIALADASGRGLALVVGDEAAGTVRPIDANGAPTGPPASVGPALGASLIEDPHAKTFLFAGGPGLEGPVQVRRLAADGTTIGAPVALAENTFNPALAVDPATGRAAVAYMLESPDHVSGGPLFPRFVYVQRLAPNGGLDGAPVLVSDAPGSLHAVPPAIAFDPATGGYEVVWVQERASGTSEVMGSHVEPQSGAASTPTAISTAADSIGVDRVDPDGARRVAIVSVPGSAAAFRVVWTAEGIDPLAESSQLYARSVAGDGMPVGQQRRLSDGATMVDFERPPAVAAGVGGSGPVALWSTIADETDARLHMARIDDADASDQAVSRSGSFLTLAGESVAAGSVSGLLGYYDGAPMVRRLGFGTGPGKTTLEPVAATQPTPSTTVRFAGTRADATFDCRLDDGHWEACGSPHSMSGLSDGPHTLDVRAAVGEWVEADPATVTWHTEATPPTTTIDKRPDPTLPATGIRFSASEPSTFECRLDDGDWVACASSFSMNGLVDGPHRAEVRATDGAGRREASPAVVSWVTDTQPPSLALTERPDSAHAVVRFESDDPDATFECDQSSVGEESRFLPCSSGDEMDRSSGRLTVRARDLAGNTSAQTVAWVVDQTPPTIAFDSHVDLPDPVRERGELMLAVDTEDGARVECRIDTADWRRCQTTEQFEGLPDGDHTAQFRAIDRTGNVSSPIQFAFTVDSQIPDTTIDSRPPAETARTSAEIAFHASRPGATFTCRLDTVPHACSSPLRLDGLREGAHYLTITAELPGGHRERTPATAFWQVVNGEPTFDNGRPTARQLSRHAAAVVAPSPPRVHVSTTATYISRRDLSLEFTTDPPDAAAECRFDGGAWEPCTSPDRHAGLSESWHRWSVRPIANAMTGAAVTREFKVDLTPPDTAIDSDDVSDGLVTSRRDVTYRVRSVGVDQIFTRGLDVWTAIAFLPSCKLDGVTAACGDTLRNLAPGRHVLEGAGVDLAGNIDPTPERLTWTIVADRPDTTIVGGPPARSDTRDAQFALEATPQADGFECRLDGGAWRACAANHRIDGLTDGTHTLEARAHDHGWDDGTPAGWTWTVDAPPAPTIVNGPPAATNVATATFHIADPDADAALECRLDGGAWVECSSDPTFPAVPDGVHVLDARATDASGRVGDATPWHWLVDTRSPHTMITGAPPAHDPSTEASLSFAADESDVRYACSIDGGPAYRCSSPVRRTGLLDGPHTIRVVASDRAGNVDPDPPEAAWTTDTEAPGLSLTFRGRFGVGWTKRPEATLSIRNDDAAATDQCRVDRGAWSACESSWTLTGLAHGTHVLEARPIDPAGNVGRPAELDLTIATAPPDTEILRGPRDPSRPDVSFDSWTDSFRYACSLDGAPFTPCAATQRYTGLAPGLHEFAVTGIDPDGDADPTPARHVWHVDGPRPDTVLEDQPPEHVAPGPLTFHFHADRVGATFECAIDRGAWAACSSPYALAELAWGTHTFWVRSVDPLTELPDDSPAGARWIVGPPESPTPTPAPTSTPGPTPTPPATIPSPIPPAPREGVAVPPQTIPAPHPGARPLASAIRRALTGRRGLALLRGRRALRVKLPERGTLRVELRLRGALLARGTVRSGHRLLRLRPTRAGRRARPGRAVLTVLWRPAHGSSARFVRTVRLVRR